MLPSSTPEITEESRAFLQHRVAVFGRGGGLAFGVFLAYRTVVSFVFGEYNVWTYPSWTYHALATLGLFAIWLVCRRGSHSVGLIRATETAGLLTTVAATTAMGMYIPLSSYPHMIVMMALTIGLALRSIYVPSSARRTFFLCSFSGVPIVASMVIAVLSADAATIDRLTDGKWQGTPYEFAFYVAINIIAWWALSIGLCTSASHVIYGLRREASKARRLGQYTLQKKLGQGGMGEVYLARHAMLRRPTAIKLLRPEKAGEKNLARFEREVQLTAQLTHPNTVTIFDYGRTPDGVFYYAMELLDGCTLDEVVEIDGRQPVARVIHVLEQITSALTESHGVGLIHRDIKPANIILCRQGGKPDVAKVVDFGLVKNLAHGEDLALTNPEIITGTPLYMSPEAIKNPAAVDNRSDLYALGAVGYLLLTGTKLFSGNSMVEICGHHLHTQPEPPSQRLRSEVPKEFEELILSCLEKDPQDRPQSAAELHSRLLDCSVEPRWNDELANQWWTTRGEKLCIHKNAKQGSSVGETLLAIDLEKRGGSG